MGHVKHESAGLGAQRQPIPYGVPLFQKDRYLTRAAVFLRSGAVWGIRAPVASLRLGSTERACERRWVMWNMSPQDLERSDNQSPAGKTPSSKPPLSSILWASDGQLLFGFLNYE